MKLRVTGASEIAILAETEHEMQWLKTLTNEYRRKEAAIEYNFPNHEPKDFNNPCITIRWDKLS